MPSMNIGNDPHSFAAAFVALQNIADELAKALYRLSQETGTPIDFEAIERTVVANMKNTDISGADYDDQTKMIDVSLKMVRHFFDRVRPQ